MRKIALVIALAASATLAYGYWHAISHGSVYLSVMDASDRERQRPIVEGDLWLLDSAGRVLAQATATAPYGTFTLSNPTAYSCQQLEGQASYSTEARDAWRRCFERQSRWLVTWVPQVTYANLKTPVCSLRRKQVIVSTFRDDWWLWWVPLPHVGGKPYTSFSLSLTFDRSDCESTSALLFDPHHFGPRAYGR
jgi:hypothetical protein